MIQEKTNSKNGGFKLRSFVQKYVTKKNGFVYATKRSNR